MGFQKTPVLSIATHVQSCSLSQSRKRTKSGVMVLKVRHSLRCCPCSGKRRQATTVFLCTSRPAHRSETICIAVLLTGRTNKQERKRGAGHGIPRNGKFSPTCFA